ncbi:alcohol acetyltransferase [Dactylonectria estremocensis]|uniref:Alcohol acetyltransferase n=1 Tax=Dactylonectria estremocensis TaxID=1079267 RepID=A0A9P9IMR3_9HYPO|nr:alcohol acetyltransferase [Dactylonectria estremocensis]
MFFMCHRLGIQSNILVSARYAPTDTGLDAGARLSSSAITAALRTVVETHAALRIVGVVQPSPKYDSHHLHIGMLHTIDMNQCIEFVDHVDSAETDFFEQLHNKWEWFEEKPDRPWWRVYVVGGRDVVFVLHHLVADANSGLVFHRTLLRALNSLPPGGPASVDPIVTIDPRTTSLFPEPMTLSHHKPSIPELIWGQIKRALIALVFGFAFLFSHMQPAKPYFRSVTDIAPSEMCTNTRVSSLRIPARKMSAVLAACKDHDTTFTALLMVMLLATFSVDLFPQDKVGCSRYAFDIRPYIQMPHLSDELASDGVMMNGVGGSFHTHWLSNYRKIVAQNSDKSGKLDDVSSINTEATWNLARCYRQSMQKLIPTKFMRSWMAGTLLGSTLESFVEKTLGGMGRVTSNSFLVSNLGAFAVQRTGTTGGEQKLPQRWRIDDMQFSAATVNGNVGSRGFVFNVVGVKGGDTVINLSYEEGVVSRETAEDLLELTMDKINLLLASEHRKCLEQ